MKKFIPIFLLIILSVTSCKKDPINKTDFPFENNSLKLEIVSSPLPSHSGITDMYFFNEASGIVISYDGKIYKTDNKGMSWTLKYTNPTPNQPLKQILFLNNNLGFVVGGANWCNGTGCICPGGMVLKTIDGGETWSTVYEQKGQVQFDGIAANSTGDLFIIQEKFTGPSQAENKILRSTNEGKSWLEVCDLEITANKIIFHEKRGFCIGQDGTIYLSKDNGNTWNKTRLISESWITDMDFTKNIGFCITSNQSVYKSIDYGDNWIKQSIKFDNFVYTIDFLTENSCLLWGAGKYTGGCFGIHYGGVLQTINSGTVWSQNEFKEIRGVIFNTSFYSSTQGYILADKLIKVTVK